MKQVRFSNGYTTYTDRFYIGESINEVFRDGDGWLGISSSHDYNNVLIPFRFGNGYNDHWDTHYCHSLIFTI